MKARKILSIALALILAIGMLSGCGGNAGSEAAKNFSETDEKLTLKWLGYPILSGAEEGSVPELTLEEKFNVDIKPMFYEQTNFNDKKTMLMAGGEIPDLVYELDPVNVFNDVDQDFIVELPYETIEKYAPTYYNYLNEYAPAAWSYSRYMDANWGVPNLNYYNGFGNVNAYRQDWLDKVGLKVPETLDEMHDVMVAFVNDDPDGNGKNDTFGYSMQETHYRCYFAEFFGAYDVLPFDWQEVNGEIVYGGLREENEDVLAVLAQWYKEGLIHPDFVAGTNQNQLTTANQIGYVQFTGYQDENNPTAQINVIREAHPDASYSYAPAPYGPDGVRGMRVWGDLCHVVSFGMTEQYGVAVPRMLKMFEGMFTDEELATKVELGNEGEHWEKVDKASTASNVYQFKGDYLESANRRLAGICAQFGGPSFFKPIASTKEFYMDNMTDSYRGWLEAYSKDDTAQADVFYKVDIIPSAADYLEDLRNKQMKLMSDIIQGLKPADTYVEEFTEIWSKGGGDIMLEEAKAQGEILEAIYTDIGVK